ncbi:MAG: GDCCVxC domain-containing (seleno)protein [Ginsengibacter sp.]
MADTDNSSKSIITCTVCGHKKEEVMPEDFYHFFYQCTKCKTVIRPSNGD